MCSSSSFLLLSLPALLLVRLGSSHSFLECSDYRAPILGQDWTEESCQGYPRYYNEIRGDRYNQPYGSTGQKSNSLNGDSNVNFCKYGFRGLSADYSEDWPYATYTVGSTIRLVWPAKNHANAADCRNYQRDAGLELYVYTSNPIAEDAESTTDPTDVTQMSLLKDWHAEAEANGIVFPPNNVGLEGVAFQNCPKFCEDTDNAVCYGDWEFTESQFTSIFGSQTGIYTFVWLWRFGGHDGVYATCYEAEVTTDGTIYNVNNPVDDASNTPAPTASAENNNNNNNGDGNDDGESSDDDSEEIEVIRMTTITIPVCYYNGQGYDEEALQSAFDALSSQTGGEVEFTITSSMENSAGNYWNASVQTNGITEEWERQIFDWADDGTICDLIKTQFRSVGMCSVCGGASGHSYDVVVETSESTSNSSSNESDDSLVTVMYVLIVVTILLLCGAGALWYYNKKNGGKGKFGQEAEVGMAQINAQASVPQTNIAVVTDGESNTPPSQGSAQGSSPESAQGSGQVTAPSRPRPPVPPPRPVKA